MSEQATLSNYEHPLPFIITAEILVYGSDATALQVINRLNDGLPDDQRWGWKSNVVTPPKGFSWKSFKDNIKDVKDRFVKAERHTFEYLAIWYADSEPLTYKSIVLLEPRDSYKPFTVNFSKKHFNKVSGTKNNVTTSKVVGVRSSAVSGPLTVNLLVPRKTFISVQIKDSKQSSPYNSFSFFITSPEQWSTIEGLSCYLPSVVISAVTNNAAEYDQRAKALVSYLNSALSSAGWEYDSSSYIVPPADFGKSAVGQDRAGDIEVQLKNDVIFKDIVIWRADKKSTTYKSSVILSSGQFPVNASTTISQIDKQSLKSGAFAYSANFAKKFGPQRISDPHGQTPLTDSFTTQNKLLTNSADRKTLNVKTRDASGNTCNIGLTHTAPSTNLSDSEQVSANLMTESPSNIEKSSEEFHLFHSSLSNSESSIEFYVFHALSNSKSSIMFPAVVITFAKSNCENVSDQLPTAESLVQRLRFLTKFDRNSVQSMKGDIEEKLRKDVIFKDIVIWHADKKTMTYKSSVLLSSGQFPVNESIPIIENDTQSASTGFDLKKTFAPQRIFIQNGLSSSTDIVFSQYKTVSSTKYTVAVENHRSKPGSNSSASSDGNASEKSGTSSHGSMNSDKGLANQSSIHSTQSSKQHRKTRPNSSASSDGNASEKSGTSSHGSRNSKKGLARKSSNLTQSSEVSLSGIPKLELSTDAKNLLHLLTNIISVSEYCFPHLQSMTTPKTYLTCPSTYSELSTEYEDIPIDQLIVKLRTAAQSAKEAKCDIEQKYSVVTFRQVNPPVVSSMEQKHDMSSRIISTRDADMKRITEAGRLMDRLFQLRLIDFAALTDILRQYQNELDKLKTVLTHELGDKFRVITLPFQETAKITFHTQKLQAQLSDVLDSL